MCKYFNGVYRKIFREMWSQNLRLDAIWTSNFQRTPIINEIHVKWITSRCVRFVHIKNIDCNTVYCLCCWAETVNSAAKFYSNGQEIFVITTANSWWRKEIRREENCVQPRRILKQFYLKWQWRPEGNSNAQLSYFRVISLERVYDR